MTSNRGKSAVEEPAGVPNSAGSRLESRDTNPHREWGRTENIPRWDSRVRRLKLPIFDRTDPDGWVFHAEWFFGVNLMPKNEKLETEILSMEREAIAWFQWEDGRRPIHRWEELKGMLLERFRPSQEGTMYEALLALHQVGAVRDYQQQFETMAALLTEVSKQVLESSFINGLRPEIQAEL